MSKISRLFSIAATIAAVSFPVGAQTPPVAIPTKDFGPVWTGFYVGAAFGAGGTFNQLDVGGPALNTNVHGSGQSGVLGLIYGGVDYQITQRGLVGLMAEASYAGFNGSVSASVPGAFAQVNQNTGFGWAVLLRAGFLADPSTLLYFTGGYAGQIINTNGTATVPGGTASFSTNNTMNGWTFGPGFETMLTNKLSAKLEYRYSQFGRQTIGSTGISMNRRRTRSAPASAIASVAWGQCHLMSCSPAVLSPSTGQASISAADRRRHGLRPDQHLRRHGLDQLQQRQPGPSRRLLRRRRLAILATGADRRDGRLYVPGHHRRHQPHDAGRQRLRHGRAEPPVERHGRLGWLPVPSTLLYAAGGYSQLNVRASAGASLGGVAPFSQRDTSFSGSTVGPGSRRR